MTKGQVMKDRKYVCRLRDVAIMIIERDLYSMTWREYSAAPRMYVSIEDETVLENLMNRKRRPYSVYKTMMRGSLLGQIFDLGKLQWSQYAGCSCPCSPGFILPMQTLNMGGRTFSHFDVWVTFEHTPAVDEKKEARELVLS
jgi:hypothetical protein